MADSVKPNALSQSSRKSSSVINLRSSTAPKRSMTRPSLFVNSVDVEKEKQEQEQAQSTGVFKSIARFLTPSKSNKKSKEAAPKSPSKGGSLSTKSTSSLASTPRLNFSRSLESSISPLFGVDLSLILQRDKFRYSQETVTIPCFLSDAINYIRKYGVSAEGVFRVGGVKTEILELRKSVELRASRSELTPRQPSSDRPNLDSHSVINLPSNSYNQNSTLENHNGTPRAEEENGHPKTSPRFLNSSGKGSVIASLREGLSKSPEKDRSRRLSVLGGSSVNASQTTEPNNNNDNNNNNNSKTSKSNKRASRISMMFRRTKSTEGSCQTQDSTEWDEVVHCEPEQTPSPKSSPRSHTSPISSPRSLATTPRSYISPLSSPRFSIETTNDDKDRIDLEKKTDIDTNNNTQTVKDKWLVFDFSGSENIHNVTGFLKMFFRELPSPLLDYSIYDSILATTEIIDDQGRLEAIKENLDRLPESNRQLLGELLALLHEISLQYEVNRMDPHNLAIVLSPNLIWEPTRSNTLYLSSIHSTTLLVQTMIEHCAYFFPELVKKYKSSLDQACKMSGGAEQTRSTFFDENDEEKAIAEAKRLFDQHDNETRGELDSLEFFEFFRELLVTLQLPLPGEEQCLVIMSAIDTDGNNMVDWNEFLSFWPVLRSSSVPAELAQSKIEIET
eukprot:TRINITY_DN913_c0_g1_i1.p1 TRINITY_DN913_c0_g1~~TRINITY_DN913_c0_g1_i1.p1  ORF type:complete len:674 (+),score=152.93 TRINITY_DN913_c0_g1_i1:69-2090(+)